MRQVGEVVAQRERRERVDRLCDEHAPRPQLRRRRDPHQPGRQEKDGEHVDAAQHVLPPGNQRA